MEQKLRDHIIKNTDALIGMTNYEKLMTECVRVNLLTPEMRLNLENISPPPYPEPSEEELQRLLHKRLFIKLTKRGPDAYSVLKTVLSTLNYERALQLLIQPHNENSFLPLHVLNGRDEPSPPEISEQSLGNEGLVLSKNEDEVDEQTELTPYEVGVRPKHSYEVVKSKQIHSDELIGTYPMRSNHNRGVLFLVNIINYTKKDPRKGAGEDSKALLHLFEEFGFTRFYYENITQKEFFKLLRTILKSHYVRDCECFVLSLMTHGSRDENEEARVEFTDGSVVSEHTIKALFDNFNCPYLVDKPKILLFPYCRGTRTDKGTMRRLQTDGIGEPKHAAISKTIPTRSDILVCYATVAGFMAIRDTCDGAWYIQKFYELMAKKAHDTHFENILKLVSTAANKLRSLKGEQQTASYLNEGFNKKLFFNPGYSDD